jgi:S-layer family protein
MKLNVVVVVAIAALVFGNAASSHAQAVSGTEPSGVAPSSEEVGDTTDTYGSSSTSYVIGAYAFDPFNPTTTIAGQGGTGDRFLTSAGVVLAPVNLPNGAVITRMEVQGCDSNAATNVFVTLYSNTTTGGTQSEINHGNTSTGGTPTPPCGFFSTNFVTPVTVNNQTRAYYVQVSTGTDSSTRFSAVRLFYNLQVSPAPATATFPNDVPTTHPFFRFVEAMAASGLTGGCGPGAFCPDTAVTRGQLAVFLAVALGLHFPN